MQPETCSRYLKTAPIGSALIVSQVPIENWYDIIAAPTIADTILDRLVHNAYRIKMEWESIKNKLSKLTTESIQFIIDSSNVATLRPSVR